MTFAPSLRYGTALLFLALAATAQAAPVHAASAPPQSQCVPPPDFINTDPPAPLPTARLVSRVETSNVAAPLPIALRAVAAVPLEQAVPPQPELPNVTGTYALTPGAFDYPGARRLVCLSDGSTLTEQLLENNIASDRAVFRYIVWNYSTAAARPIRYAVGEFVRTSASDGSTDVRWTYAFKMNRNRFPGLLGFIGDALFRSSFLDTRYARMMQETLAADKARAEALAREVAR